MLNLLSSILKKKCDGTCTPQPFIYLPLVSLCSVASELWMPMSPLSLLLLSPFIPWSGSSAVNMMMLGCCRLYNQYWQGRSNISNPCTESRMTTNPNYNRQEDESDEKLAHLVLVAATISLFSTDTWNSKMIWFITWIYKGKNKQRQ